MHWRYRCGRIAPVLVKARILIHRSDHDGWFTGNVRDAGVAATKSSIIGIGQATFGATANDIARAVAAWQGAIKVRIRQPGNHPVHIHGQVHGIGCVMLKRLFHKPVILVCAGLIRRRIGERHDGVLNMYYVLFVCVFSENLSDFNGSGAFFRLHSSEKFYRVIVIGQEHKQENPSER